MPSFAVIAALLVMLALLGSVNLYLSLRIHRCLTHFCPQFPVGWVIAAFFLMTLVLIAGFFRSMLPIPAVLRNVLGVVSACWMGAFVYLLLYMLLADGLYLLCRCFLPPSPLRVISILAAVVLTLGTCVWGVWHANDHRHVSYDVPLSADASAGNLSVVMISDLHLGAVGSEGRLENIVRGINSQEPDIICIAGDFFDNDFHAIHQPEKAAQTLRGLQARYGVYVCPGNHDSGATVPEMLRFWEACNIRLLADDYVVIDGRYVLAGRRDASPIGGFDGGRRSPLEEVLASAPAEMPVIVLDHNPAGAWSYDSGVSLVLSGHTHKGQIFPGSLFTDRMFDVDHGLWQKDADSPPVIVSSGVGTWGMPMRVGTDSEIVTVRLTTLAQ